ncbi:zinc finger protein 436-like [Ischnura elegans]|uniref:zinc finger protein 436-like n=1 Tax=Ischnura elegans TaxID=197161 RepID=UPI001ED8B896|nr:zinc finger protein 436-like [Ischnura elegans]
MESTFKYILCRLCLCESASLMDIFEESYDHGFVISEVIEDLLHFKVMKLRGLPWLVCARCFEKLREFRLFKIQCIDSKVAFESRFLIDGKHAINDQVEIRRVRKEDLEAEHERALYPQVELSRIKVERGEIELEQEFYPQVILETVEEGDDALDNQTTATDDASLLPKETTLLAAKEEGGGGGAVGGGCLGPPLVVRASVRHFGCPCCGKSFVKSSHLTRHIRTHTNERPFACDLCGKRYIENSDLTSHKMSHSGRRPFSCPVCGKGFYRNSHLNRHVNTHRAGRATVEQPATMDSAAVDVIGGLKREEGEQDANVHFMGRLLEGNNGCRPSVHNNHLQRLSWLRDERLLLHPNGGSGVKTELIGDVPADDYSPECGLADDGSQGVNGLGDVADGDSGKHCVCSHCGKGFGKSSQLLCHARTHHSGELPFACGDCGRRYVKASDLTQHAKSHSAVKPHRCVQCGKGFTKSSHLKRHCITHTDERPYSCAVCRKGFVESSDLNRHMAVHTGTDEGVGAVEYATQEGRREYVCRLCGKGFSFRSNLVAHVRTHSGSKPFVCEHCGRGFAQSGNLRTHLRVHTGERPFACGVCHKRFSQKSTLNHHAKTH